MLVLREVFLEFKDWYDWMYGLEASFAVGLYILYDFCYKYVDFELYMLCF